jgi:hypothetical protein
VRKHGIVPPFELPKAEAESASAARTEAVPPPPAEHAA